MISSDRRNKRICEQVELLTQHHELATHQADGFAVVLSKIRDGLEVRGQTPGEPHQLDVALRVPDAAKTVRG